LALALSSKPPTPNLRTSRPSRTQVSFYSLEHLREMDVRKKSRRLEKKAIRIQHEKERTKQTISIPGHFSKNPKIEGLAVWATHERQAEQKTMTYT
jgi:hypothetical protein